MQTVNALHFDTKTTKQFDLSRMTGVVLVINVKKRGYWKTYGTNLISVSYAPVAFS